MYSITRCTQNDAAVLSVLARDTFIESHGHSAPPGDIANYINEKYSTAVFTAELNHPGNVYHIIYHDGIAAGFSKIIFNLPYAGSALQNIAKLERIYLLKVFYGLQLGQQLFRFNMDLCRQHHQQGIWLYVWKENARAVNFYTKAGFKIIGSYDFKISATHANPNHQMLLEF